MFNHSSRDELRGEFACFLVIHLELGVFGSKNYPLQIRSRLLTFLGDLRLVTRYADLTAAVVGPAAIIFR